jgi:hypothetical protein
MVANRSVGTDLTASAVISSWAVGVRIQHLEALGLDKSVDSQAGLRSYGLPLKGTFMKSLVCFIVSTFRL